MSVEQWFLGLYKICAPLVKLKNVCTSCRKITQGLVFFVQISNEEQLKKKIFVDFTQCVFWHMSSQPLKTNFAPQVKNHCIRTLRKIIHDRIKYLFFYSFVFEVYSHSTGFVYAIVTSGIRGFT